MIEYLNGVIETAKLQIEDGKEESNFTNEELYTFKIGIFNMTNFALESALERQLISVDEYEELSQRMSDEVDSL